MKRFHLNAATEQLLGFSQAVEAGGFLFVSGTVAVDENLEPLHAGDWAAQCREIYLGLQKTLEAHGLDFEDVVKETIIAADLAAFFEQANGARKTFYPAGALPAATAVEARHVGIEGNLLEIELIALSRTDRGRSRA